MKNIRQFDLVWVDFGDNNIGSEQGGIRPAVIIQNDAGNCFSSTTIVMPLTKHVEKNPNQSTHTLLTKGGTKGLTTDSMVLGECMRQISNKRILKRMGKISDEKEKKEIQRVYFANANF